MRNDGKKLERFVTKFHEVFSKENTKIETNKKIYRDGICQAEIDVLITDKISSVPIQIAIECRDRKKTQGKDWIEQIIGRKENLKYDKYIAVSSSGFTKPAISLAKQHNIILRTTSDCSDIVEDFSLSEFTFSYPIFEMSGPFRIASINKSLQNIDLSGLLLKRRVNDTYLNLNSFIIKNLPRHIDRNSSVWQNVIIDLPGDIFLKLDEKEYKVNHFRANGVYSYQPIKAKAIGIKTFNEDNECLGQQVRIFAPYPQGAWVDFLFIKNNDDKTYTFNIIDSAFPSDISMIGLTMRDI